MFNYIINFFSKSQSEIKKETQLQHDNHLFNQQYRRSYNKLWIEKIRNYHP